MLKPLYLFFSCNMQLNLILSQAKDQTKANDEMDRCGVPQRQVSGKDPKGLKADVSSQPFVSTEYSRTFQALLSFGTLYAHVRLIPLLLLVSPSLFLLSLHSCL